MELLFALPFYRCVQNEENVQEREKLTNQIMQAVNFFFPMVEKRLVERKNWIVFF